MIQQASKFWRWIVASSANPQEVSLMVKGMTSFTIVQAIFSMLPMFGIHPKFDLNGLGDALYAFSYGGLSLVASLVSLLGAIRKLKITVFG